MNQISRNSFFWCDRKLVDLVIIRKNGTAAKSYRKMILSYIIDVEQVIVKLGNPFGSSGCVFRENLKIFVLTKRRFFA
jgi:hypothetical protein